MRSPLRVGIGLFSVIALAAGCGGHSLSPDGGGGHGGTTGTAGTMGSGGTGGGTGGTGGMFTPTRDVDILFMIDNSSSTSLIQANLTANFPTFMTALRNQPGGLPNLHVAIINSDMGAGDGSIAGCNSTGGNQGIFQYTPRGACTTSPLMPNNTFITDVSGQKNYTGTLEDAFTCLAKQGETGCGFEQPLASIARALGADGRGTAPAENQTFLRPNALLFIVIVTNEDDCSVPSGSTLFSTASTTLASALGPVQNFRCNEFGHLCNGAKPPRMAPNGDVTTMVVLDGCAPAEGSGMLTPVATFVSQLRALKAFPDDQILIGLIAAAPTPYEVIWKTPSTADTGPWPVIAHSCAASDGSFGDPAVRLTALANAFGPNGLVTSVCDTNYAPIFTRLADLLARALDPSAH
jgi:hypothetical protein